MPVGAVPTGADGVISGAAAAFWLGLLDQAPATVEVTVAGRSRLQGAAGVRLRRRDLHPEDRAVVRGVPVTATALTVLETSLRDGSVFLDRALQQRRTTLPELRRAHRRRLGARGNRALLALLCAADQGGESAAERQVVKLLRRAGITGWVLGHPYGPWTIDLAFPAARLAIEVDGWAWHTDPDRFRADRRKGNALTRGGWTLLRFTWHDLQHPARVLADIRAVLGP